MLNKPDNFQPPLYDQFTALTRFHKKLIMVIADLIMLPLALWTAYALRLADWWPIVHMESSLPLFIIIPPLGVFIFARLGLYRAVVRFIGSQAMWAVCKGVFLLMLAIYLLAWLLPLAFFSRSAPIIFALVSLIYVGGSRFLVRGYYHRLLAFYAEKAQVIIYGAGHAGVELSNSLGRDRQYVCVAFIDDNPALWHSVIAGKRVYSPEKLESVIADLGVKDILLAIPSLEPDNRRKILNRLLELPVRVRSIPAHQDIVSGKAELEQIREVAIEDLLGRQAVKPIPELISRSVQNKVVVVTGAGGSIGSEICRQVLRQKPKMLILFEQSEYNLYYIDANLRQQQQKQQTSIPILAVLGSVLDKSRLVTIFTRFNVDTVYHAAAYKHVPLVEQNITEGIRNNIFGTQVAALSAMKTGVKRFILISTDKAVRPTNIMGASKRMAEQVLQLYAKQAKTTIFSMVRFGNVLGSSGSVVPLFRQQIRSGGPVTVTHPDVIRYFMTISEAASLVIQAGSMAKGGEVFLLNMGDPVNIADMAQKMIHLMGHRLRSERFPEGDIEIKYTGLRPGEKLYEELLIEENSSNTEHPDIAKAHEEQLAEAQLESLLSDLQHACENYDGDSIYNLLLQGVSGYQPESSLVDPVTSDYTLVNQA